MDVQAGSGPVADIDLGAVRMELFIDGAWVPGEGVISVINPADGGVLAEVANGTPDHARLALMPPSGPRRVGRALRRVPGPI